MPGPIGAVRVFTGRFEKSVAFYRDQLGLDRLSAHDGVAIFDTGQAKLVIEQVDADVPEEAELIGRFAGFSFTVQDIRESFAALSGSGVDFDGRPEIQPWGGAMAHFFDPDGNVLTLVQYPSETTVRS